MEKNEVMSNEEVAFNILKDHGKKIKILDLYKKVCKEQGIKFYPEDITDFYDLLSANKKFVILDKGYCDLQLRNKSSVFFYDEDIEEDEEFEDFFSEEEDEKDEDEDEIFYDELDDDEDDDEDLSDFIIMDEDELEDEE